MIKKVNGYIIVCDKCGKKFEGEDNGYDFGYDFFEHKKEAIELLEDDCRNNDWQYINKKTYCEECRTY